MNREQAQRIANNFFTRYEGSANPEEIYSTEMNNRLRDQILDESSLPSPSLPSDEEKKKSVINKILDDLPIREVRGEMSPDEWYGWFEEW